MLAVVEKQMTYQPLFETCMQTPTNLALRTLCSASLPRFFKATLMSRVLTQIYGMGSYNTLLKPFTLPETTLSVNTRFITPRRKGPAPIRISFHLLRTLKTSEIILDDILTVKASFIHLVILAYVTVNSRLTLRYCHQSLTPSSRPPNNNSRFKWWISHSNHCLFHYIRYVDK